MEEFDIYIRGFVPQREPTEVGLERVFGIERPRALELLRSLPRVVKRRVPGDEIERYAQALRGLGADYELRRSAIRPAQIIAVKSEEADQEAAASSRHGSTLSLPPPPNGDSSAEEPPAAAAPTQPAPRFPETLAASAAELAAGYVEAPARPSPEQPTLHEPTPEAALPRWRWPENIGERPAADPPAVRSAPHATPHGAIDWPQSPGLAPADDTAATCAEHAPEPPPAPGPAVRAPVDPSSVSDPWVAIEPKAPASAQGELPEPWEVPGLRGDGRPDWLVDGNEAYAPEVIAAPPPEFDYEPLQHAAAPRPAPPRSGNPFQVGTVIGRELRAELPLGLRIALRSMMGLSLFLLWTTLRQCRAVDHGVEQALASWSSAEPAAAEPAAKHEAASLADGPEAAEWLASDLHQCTSGDKDRVRDLAGRFKRAGAPSVRVGAIMRNGPVEVAGELVIELPRDPEPRRAVLAEYQRFLEATFGSLAGTARDPGGDVLRVAL